MPSRPTTTDSADHEADQGGRFVTLESAKHLLLTTFKQDGTPMAAAVRVVAGAGRAYFGVRDSSGTATRLRGTDWVQVVPCTALGMISFGPRVNATARELAGDEAREAAGLLARRQPAWRESVSALARRVTRRRTVYYELRPDEAAKEPAVTPRVPPARTERGRRLPPVPLRSPGPG